MYYRWSFEHWRSWALRHKNIVYLMISMQDTAEPVKMSSYVPKLIPPHPKPREPQYVAQNCGVMAMVLSLAADRILTLLSK